MAARTILALDLGTRTGWAVGEPGCEAPRAGTRRLGPDDASIGRLLDAYDQWLADMVTVHAPALLVFEAPLVARHGNVAAARKLFALASHTELVAWRRELRCEEISVFTARKHFCGHGRAGKPGAQAECDRRGWTWADDNAADALAVWGCAEALKAPRAAGRRVGLGL